MKKGIPSGSLTLEQALSRYQPYLSAEDYARLKLSAEQPAATAIRVNLLKSKHPQADLAHWAWEYGWQVSPLPFSESSEQINAYQTSPTQTIEHRLGYYYIQDGASILPVSLFDSQKPAKLTLDMAASPGGKTTQLVDLTLDQGFVFANDSSASRLPALKIILQQWGAVNAGIFNFAGEKIGFWFPEKFDRVLLDAPCSMESLRTSPSRQFREITADERNRLASRQLDLLISAVSAAKPGGEIVYSTCSLAPEEDEMVLDQFLRHFPGLVQVDSTAAKKYGTLALSAFGDEHFLPEVSGALRIWPFSFNTNGFFAAKLIKLTSMPQNPLRKPSREFAATGFTRCDFAERSQVKAMLQNWYGVKLDKISELQHLGLFKKLNNLYLLPEAYLQNFSTLPYYALGLPLGRLFSGELEVTAEFIGRYGSEFSQGFLVLTSEQVKPWLNGLDLRDPKNIAPAGSNVLAIRDQEGHNLGAGKIIPGRLRNLLPNYNLRLG